MNAKHTTTNTTTTTNNDALPCARLHRLLGALAVAATTLTSGGCADLDDGAWAETRGETASDSFDDEDFPIGRHHELENEDPEAWIDTDGPGDEEYADPDDDREVDDLDDLDDETFADPTHDDWG